VPAELSGILTGVFGVDERRVVKPRHAPAAGAAVGLVPSELAKRYRFPAGDGAGQKIAIAEFGGGCFREDITAYCKMAGVKDANAQVTTVALGHPAYTLEEILELPDPDEQDSELGAAGEVMMDIQIVAGLCPAADILVYFAPFSEQGWIDVLSRAVKDRPVALSISWGSAERAPIWSNNALNNVDSLLNSLALLGVTVCVAAGDDGSGDLMFDGRAHVDFPASSAFVLAVGGTTILHGVEQVWWNMPGARFDEQGGRTHGGATGGGVSERFRRPTWQDVDIPSVNLGHPLDGRVVPDVAALAGAPGYQLVFQGKPGPNGGTSASAPLWASLIARVQAALPDGKGQRFLTPLLYQPGADGIPNGASACQDIAVGHDNSSNPDPGVGYAPAAGYDAATGWGVPDGEGLLKVLS
jgi:kumamolisin